MSGQGAILRWDETEWKIDASGLGPLTAVWGSGPTDVRVGGQSVLFHGTGASPAALTFAATARPMGEIASIRGTRANDIWAVVVRNGSLPRSLVLHYAPGDGGGLSSWSEVAVDAPEMRFSHVWGTAASGVWLGGILGDVYSDAPGRIYRRPPGATEFTPVLAPADSRRSGDRDGVRTPASSSASRCSRTRAWCCSVERPSGTRCSFAGRARTAGKRSRSSLPSSTAEFNGLWSFAVAATAEDDLWVAGEYGRMRHWNGSRWTASALTITKFPVVSNLYAFWAKGPKDLWVVGDGIALHLDPAKKK